MDSPTEITANQEDRSKHGDIAVEKTGLYQNYVFLCFVFVFPAGFASGPRFYIRCYGDPTPILFMFILLILPYH